MIVGHRSVYPSQLLQRSKSSLLDVPEKGRRIDQDLTVPVPERSPVLGHLSLRMKRKK